jgi:hypothetical protein
MSISTSESGGKYPQVSGVVTIEPPPLVPGTEGTDKPVLDLAAPSIKDIDQAWNLCKSTESANKTRSQRATLMELEYTGQSPFSPDDQREKAQNWQSNSSTGILQGIVDRKTLRFVNAITGQIYLTRSSLPTTWTDWKRKSDTFCIHTTRMVQGWENYATFVNSLAKEDVLHGYGFAIFLDPFTWKPTFKKQEIAYVPDETGQHSSELQFFVVKEDFLLHEFVDLFTKNTDEAAAVEMGYDLKNCVEAANQSSVKNPREDMAVTEFRKMSEFISDGVLGLTYATSGPRVVKTYLLWNREYDGKITFWIIEREKGKMLRMATKIYDTFPDVTTLFSFQPGNGHLHSSKGVGRMLIGLVKMAEKLRNKMADMVIMAGLVILKANSKDRNKLQPVVHSPFVVVDSSIEVVAQKFPADPTLFGLLDQRLNNWMEQAAGAYIAQNVNEQGEPRTATEVSVDAQRAKEADDVTEARWKDQFMCLVGTIQRRAYADDIIDEASQIFATFSAGATESESTYDATQADKDAVRTIVNMLKDGLTVDEIKMLRSAPPSGYAHTDDAVTSQGILAVKKGYTGNPNVDQVKLDARSIEALAGPDVSKDLIIPQPDQTLVAEAKRMQLQESTAMMLMQEPQDVSPRDNHLIHGAAVVTVLQKLGPGISSLGCPQETLKAAELNLNHLGAHLQAYTQAGGVTQNPDYKQLNDFYMQFKQNFAQAVAVHEAAKFAAGVHPVHGAAIIGGAKAPPTAPPPGAAVNPQSVAAGMPQGGPPVPAAGADLDFQAPGPIAPPQPAQAAA